MRILLVICFLALTNLSQAITLELAFDQQTFNPTTTGTFRLSGYFGMWGNGSGGGYHIFDATFRGASTPNLANDLWFNLNSSSATGTALRDSITHSVAGFDFVLGAGGLGYTSEPYPFFRLYVDSSLALGPDPFAGALVDVAGTFTATRSGGAGMTLADMAGDYQPSQYDGAGTTLTLAVPEPSTLSLLSLAAAPLFFRRRKSS
ncbi:MAG: PEP-CTERM sorting domain-containing protein [Verrucomicrobia bacterium]|nr:PEP-CTERM sorting domain-containing protein [Verrucomicrobiota bacterium]